MDRNFIAHCLDVIFGKNRIAGDIRWQAVFFMGGAGSGKSTIRDQKYKKYFDFHVVDPDEIKKTHPEFDPEAPYKVHGWSRDIANSQFKEIVTNGKGEPVVVDGTGRSVDDVEIKLKMAEKNGYRTYIVWVYVPFEISIWRNRNRQRFVPELTIVEQYEKIPKSFKYLKSLADKSKVIPNYESAELAIAKDDIALWPVGYQKRPPRPGESGYELGANGRQAGMLRRARFLRK